MPLILFLMLISCRVNTDTKGEPAQTVYESRFTTDIEDAAGFEIITNDSCFILKIKSLSISYPFSDSIVFPKHQLAKRAKLWQSNWQRLACQSTTHLTFLNALGGFDKIVGLSDIKFMPKDITYHKVMQAGIKELNKNNTIDIEQLVGLEPDLFFMYPFEWESKKYQQADIKTLLVAEYLEQTPIARLEWIKVFGLIVGQEALADSLFRDTKQQYNSLKALKPINKSVFFNLPFKELWDMPAPKSITVNLIHDAGLTYVFDHAENSIDNISMSKENVWSKVHEADYWIIIASRPIGFTLNDLLSEEAVYETFQAVKQGQVIFCNTNQSGYFTEGILEPEMMLKDLLFLTNQIDSHSPKYFQLLQ